MAFAMAQIRASNKLVGLAHYLTDLWQSSTRVAAFAFVLARSCTKINPDEAMLTGMMHGIGKLYVLTRAIDHPELFADVATLNEIIDDWHASIGKSILENWEFADFMSQAVGDQNDLERDEDGPADLRDVIAIAVIMASFTEDLSALEVALNGLPAVLRLGLDATKSLAIARRHLVPDAGREVVFQVAGVLGDVRQVVARDQRGQHLVFDLRDVRRVPGLGRGQQLGELGVAARLDLHLYLDVRVGLVPDRDDLVQVGHPRPEAQRDLLGSRGR